MKDIRSTYLCLEMFIERKNFCVCCITLMSTCPYTYIDEYKDLDIYGVLLSFFFVFFSYLLYWACVIEFFEGNIV